MTGFYPFFRGVTSILKTGPASPVPQSEGPVRVYWVYFLFLTAALREGGKGKVKERARVRGRKGGMDNRILLCSLPAKNFQRPEPLPGILFASEVGSMVAIDGTAVVASEVAVEVAEAG